MPQHQRGPGGGEAADPLLARRVQDARVGDPLRPDGGLAGGEAAARLAADVHLRAAGDPEGVGDQPEVVPVGGRERHQQGGRDQGAAGGRGDAGASTHGADLQRRKEEEPGVMRHFPYRV